jgi:hypothetical protein
VRGMDVEVVPLGEVARALAGAARPGRRGASREVR